jgi:hypothetical protein
VGEGGEVGLEGGFGGEVTLGQVLALEKEKDSEGQEFSQGGLLVLLLWGKLEALGLEGFEFIVYPDVGSHEKGFRVKMVKGVLTVLLHGTPSFFTPQGSGSSSTRRHQKTVEGFGLVEVGGQGSPWEHVSPDGVPWNHA